VSPVANRSRLESDHFRTPEARVGSTDRKPVGRGSARNVNCATGTFSSEGGCQTANQTWSSGFGVGEIYYVRVFNNNTGGANILLAIAGAGVGFATPIPDFPSPPTLQGPTSPAISGPPFAVQTIDDPNGSVSIDCLPHRIAANSDLASFRLFSPERYRRPQRRPL
jgi:hypothetical protein